MQVCAVPPQGAPRCHCDTLPPVLWLSLPCRTASCTAPADWRDQTILHLRILRKRALRQALERVGAALRGGNSRPGGGGGAATAAEL